MPRASGWVTFHIQVKLPQLTHTSQKHLLRWPANVLSIFMTSTYTYADVQWSHRGKPPCPTCRTPEMPSSWFPTSYHSTRWSSPQPLTNCSKISPASSSDSSIFQSMRKGKRKLLCLQRNIFRDGDFFLDNYNFVQWQPVSWSSPPYLMAISSLWGVVFPNSSQIKQLTGRMRMAQSGTHIASSTSLPCFIFHLPAG